MAKKKVDPQAESNPHKTQDKVDDDETIEEDTAPEKLAKLKALNALLLKETVERRKLVDSLSQSNGHLKSELNRSVMDNGLLQSEMNVLTEKTVMLEIEKGLVPVFVIGQMNQLAEERIESLKERIGSLESEMKRIFVEKNEMEKSNSEKESEISDLKRRLDEVMAKVDEERRVSSRVCDERDEIKAQLDARVQEVNELQLKVTEAEKTEAQISEEVMELKANLDKLVQENTVNMQRVDSITNEKNLIEEALVESNAQIDGLKKNIDDLLEQKKAMEDEKDTHEKKNDELQTMVRELKDLIESMKIDEKELLDQITDLEKKYSTSSENEAMMQTQIKGLIEEKKETDERIESLETEKSLVLKDLQDAIKDLENQKLTIEQIVQEKTKLEDAKSQGESEIVKMKEQFSIFQDTITDLEKKYSTSSENEVILQNQIVGLIEEQKEKDTRIESLENGKSSGLKELQDAMKELEHQKLTIEQIVQEKTELENAKIQGESEIAKMKEQLITFQDTSSEKEVILQNQIHALIEEKKERDERIESLENKKSSVLKDLDDVMQELEHQNRVIQQIIQEKTELENAKIEGESEIVKMKEQLIAFQDTVSSYENSSIDQNQKVKQLEAAVNHYQLTIEQIIQEKTELENAKIEGESEIVKMKEQLIAFQDTVSSFENSSTDQNQKLKQLQDEVSHYKASFDEATIGRDEALKSLEEQEATKTDFQHKITGMEKEIKDLHESLAKMTTENGKNVAEKNEFEDRCAELTKNVAALETKLAETLIDFDETKMKLGLAEANSNRVLNTLKKTLSVGIETRDFDLGNGGIEEEIKDDVREVEEIKRAFKEKEIRVEEMKRQLEIVKNVAGKEKSFWTLVSSATTLLAAAVSVAYVARAN